MHKKKKKILMQKLFWRPVCVFLLQNKLKTCCAEVWQWHEIRVGGVGRKALAFADRVIEGERMKIAFFLFCFLRLTACD